MSKTVCVTGATGYVGSHVTEALLSRGYRVRACVRKPADKDRAAHLFALEGAAERLELVGGALEQEGSFDRGMVGADAVIHTASVVVLTADDPQREIIDVAVLGSENVVRAAKKSGSVKRFIMTSSTAAVFDATRPKGHIFTERDYNDSSTVKNDAYATSKVQAERAARALATEPGGRRLEFSAILPSLVLGPVMCEAHLRTSPVVLYDLMRGAFPGVPNLVFPVVDVRDVAQAHVLALEADALAERYLCTAENVPLRQITPRLRTRHPAAKVPKRGLPDLLMYATALFDKRLTFEFLRQNLGSAPSFDASLVQRKFGLCFRPTETTVDETADSIVAGGYLAH